MKVIVLRALPWGKDARIVRWKSVYKNYKFIFGVWGNENKEKNIYSITNIPRNPSNKLSIGLGYAVFSIMGFLFVLKYAKKNDIVIFTDLETVLFGFFAAKIKGLRIHYDVADPFYLVKPIPLKWFWKKLEEFFINKIQLVTFPHKVRLLNFDNIFKKNILIVENIPNFTFEKNNNLHMVEDKYIKIGYYGNLEPNVRGIEELIKATIYNKNLVLHIGGSGLLEGYIKKISIKEDRIIFIGDYQYENLINLVKNIDLYIGFYDQNKKLHYYAAPNKYYEHLCFGLPILTSIIIPESKKVVRYNTGYCFKNKEEFYQFLLTINAKEREKFFEMGKNAYKVWEKKYKKYYECISTKILKMI